MGIFGDNEEWLKKQEEKLTKSEKTQKVQNYLTKLMKKMTRKLL